MPSLRELQRDFRTVVLAGESLAPPSVIVGGQVGAAARLGVYRNNVIGNLTRALQLSYPAVERLVGKDFFAAAAQQFIVAAPPRAADLNRYGDGFPAFLASFEAARSVSYLADVARLEWAVSCALHARPASPLLAEALSAVPPERQADLRLHPHPTLSLLALDHPARAIWEAVLSANADQRDARLAKIDPESGGERLAVLRSDGMLSIETLPDPAFDLIQALTNGRPLCEALARVSEQEAASLLADFLTRGFFGGFSLPTDSALTTTGAS